MSVTHVCCVPHAGAGAALFRTGPDLPGLVVCPVQLPGREERFGEPPVSDLDVLADDCAEQIARLVPDGDRYAVFGHSFGAHVAAAAVRRPALRRRPPERLVVSGAAAPHLPRPVAGVAELDDDTLLAAVRDLVGYDHAALRHPVLRRLLLPALRADLTAHERHRPALAEARVAVPITAVHAADDPVVTRAGTQAWAEVTSAAFELRTVAGGHMWLVEDRDLLWATIGAALAGAAC